MLKDSRSKKGGVDQAIDRRARMISARNNNDSQPREPPPLSSPPCKPVPAVRTDTWPLTSLVALPTVDVVAVSVTVASEPAAIVPIAQLAPPACT